MREKEFIKKAIDENIADRDAIIARAFDGAPKQYSKPGRTAKWNIARAGISFGIVFILVFGLVYIDIPLPWNTAGNKKTKVTSDSNLEKNSFTLTAYAMANSNRMDILRDPAVKQESRTQLAPNAKVMMPSGKIVRGKYSSYRDEKGTLHESYEAGFDGGTGFICSGENIESVTFTSVNGELKYWDTDLARELEAKGELYICRIPIGGTKIKPNGANYEEIKRAFNEMLEKGELDEYKNKYFGGRNIDLDDYEVEFRGGISEDGTEGRFMIIRDRNKNPYPYIKTGKTIEAKADRVVSWTPVKAIEKVMSIEQLKYEELPGDSVTVVVKFKDGQVQTKTVMLSFNSEGNIIAEIK